MNTPDHEEMNEALARVDAAVDAAESHGVLCGLLSANPETPEQAWLVEVLPEDEGETEDAAVKELLGRLYVDTRRQIADERMGFGLLLPDDESIDLDARVAALGRWCQGYLYGLGAAGASDSTIPGDSAEFIRDLAEIARVTLEGGADESGEEAYGELVEFVRMGVLLVREEMKPRKPH